MNVIKIQNESREAVLYFPNIEDRENMIKAINNCLIDSDNFPTLDYHDKTDHIIFTANYLKNSLIIIPNP